VSVYALLLLLLLLKKGKGVNEWASGSVALTPHFHVYICT